MTSGGVSVSDLAKHFGRTRALNGLTMSAGLGVTGLLGPNGAGKTTFLRIAATVIEADRGEMTVLGRDVSDPRQRLEVRRRLGYMPQDANFHRAFTVFEAIDYVALLKEHAQRRARHDEVRRVLSLVGLSDAAGKRVRALSGGMRRRLGLAQALLGAPELLVLDEPTAGLDPEQRLRFRDLISAAGEDRTIILSTHQTEDVAALCQRVVVIDRGHALFSGTVPEMLTHAVDRVWVADTRSADALACWRLGTGEFRHIGDPPPGARTADATLEDAYLLLLGRAPSAEAA
jgi:ABC-2 type transport system ATP-binding protein